MGAPLSIAIAGGGIGGLAAALACAREGFKVVVFERAPGPETAGAGIQVSPNAGRVLADLGLDAAIAGLAAEPTGIDIRSWRGRRIVRLPLGRRFARRHAIPYRTIHRADLLRVLADAAAAVPSIDLRYGSEVVEFALHPHGLTVMAATGRGHVEIRADALIAADGIGSFVRSVMPNARPRIDSGRSAWRLLVAADAAPPPLSPDRIGLWLGRNGHIVHYPVRGGAEFNIVAVCNDEVDGAGFEAVRRRFRRWAAPAQALLAVDGAWQRWPIGTVHPGGPWTSGRVALLGDAAHAMAPYLAQGGAVAIEDAAVLARCLAERPDDVPAALARYEALRKPRVRRVWRAARSAADLYHMGAVTGAVRNTIMRLLGGTGLAWRYAWIYGWRPPAKGRRRAGAAPSAVSDDDVVAN